MLQLKILERDFCIFVFYLDLESSGLKCNKKSLSRRTERQYLDVTLFNSDKCKE